MGYALPTAIGASVASNRRVIVIEGDGSLQYNIMELATIARLGLNIKIFIINNGGFASIRNTHNKFFGNNPVKDLKFPILEYLAKSSLIDYDKPFLYGWDDFYDPYFESKLPYIFDIKIDPGQKKEIV
jgi:acetolactate synthase-1/2/3 large subunit